MHVTFKAKVVEGVFSFPTIRKHHCNMSQARTSALFRGVANSALFESAVNRRLSREMGLPVGRIGTVEDVRRRGVEVTPGFLHTFTVDVQ